MPSQSSSPAYWPPIPATRPRPTKPRLAELLLPHRGIRSSSSMPLLKTRPLEDEGRGGLGRRLRRKGSDLLGLGKKEEEWQVVDVQGEGAGLGLGIRMGKSSEKVNDAGRRRRKSAIMWPPPSPQMGGHTAGSEHISGSTFGSSPRRLSAYTDIRSASGSHTSPESPSGMSALEFRLSSFPFPPSPKREKTSGRRPSTPPLPVDHPFNTPRPPRPVYTPPGIRSPDSAWWGGTAGEIHPSPPLPPRPLLPRLRHPSIFPFPSPRHRNRTHPPAEPPPTPPSPPPSPPEGITTLSTLLHLRHTLLTHAVSTQLLLDSYTELLPPHVLRDLGREVDEWWTSWRSALNKLASQVIASILVLPLPHPPAPPPPPAGTPPHPYLSPPFTPDSLQPLIWGLEERGEVPSFTFARMFGRPRPGVEMRRMEDEEVWEATKKGWREWQNGEWGMLEREGWRDVGGRRKRGVGKEEAQ
ncbi:hypothetical protein IAT38_004047 [Cryptococcus sp. DSM 104549]